VFSSSSSRTRQSIPIHFSFLSATFHISGVRENKTLTIVKIVLISHYSQYCVNYW